MMTIPEVSSNPILIVGAGTTGLMLACVLARHGTPLRIVDRLPGIVHTARATGVHSRTLEAFQDFGIVEQIIEQAAKIRGTRQYAGGEQILHFRLDGLDSPFPFVASLEQWKVEEALQELLTAYGVEVERETELVGLEEQHSGVKATLRRPDGSTEAFRTPWLVGCDGAHSTVRHLKGEDFPGEADPRQYLVADVILDEGLETDEAYVYLTDDGAMWQFPLPGGRSLVAGDVHEQHDPGEVPSLEDVQAMIDQRALVKRTVKDAHWLSWFHINYRLIPHYRHGRTFLAGDAAHIHSLVGGQGMNTGIQDAYNLGWKLALVASGLAPESLLDSYEIERRAVASDVLKMTRSLTEKAEQYVTLPPKERDRLYSHVVMPEADRMKLIRHSEELDLDYRQSPISLDCLDGTSNDPVSMPRLHAGTEARDAGPLVVNENERSLFELLRGNHHTLLVVPGSKPQSQIEAQSLRDLAAEVERAYGSQIRVCRVLPAGSDGPILDVESAVHQRYGSSDPRLYLIRPDGYIGFRGEVAHGAELMAHLGRIFA
jgi:2-polyprenyl-6-methoxyphenol hydroxylase-like FAD-dependent oxidoreductase